MILNHVKMADTGELLNIRVAGDKITGASAAPFKDADDHWQLLFHQAMVFPGLINSHDHLDFNLFPRLGNRTYTNYTEWGKDIHKTHKKEIAGILKVPALLRSEWGVYKNLLCGITTVINHGEKMAAKNAPITIFENSHCLHSVRFEKRWKLKLNNPFKAQIPVNIHIGEGDDWSSYEEIDQLIKWNLLKKKIIGVHAVAMSESQAKNFEAIVWCPQSNYFLLNTTARVNLLKKHTNLLFGTDSTLTGNWNIWDHLQLARQTKLIDDVVLYQTLNQNAAKAWQLNSGEIAAGRDADLVIANIKPSKKALDAFFAIHPADLLIVMHKGNIRLFDETMRGQLEAINISAFSKIYVNGICKYVQGDLPGLMEKIKKYYPAARFPVSATEHQA